MNLADLIAAVIAAKQGDKEFALFFRGSSWDADIGNECLHVGLGEVSGEFSADGATPEAAVAALLAQVESANKIK